jgi:hypothetical protein
MITFLPSAKGEQYLVFCIAVFDMKFAGLLPLLLLMMLMVGGLTPVKYDTRKSLKKSEFVLSKRHCRLTQISDPPSNITSKSVRYDLRIRSIFR